MLSTIGCSIILQNVATNVWGSDPYQLPDEFMGGRFDLGMFSIGEVQLIVIIAAIVLVALLAFMMKTALQDRNSSGRVSQWVSGFQLPGENDAIRAQILV